MVDNCRSLVDANSRENSKITLEIAQRNNCETTSRVARKLDEIRLDINSQILRAIDSVTTEKVYPSPRGIL